MASKRLNLKHQFGGGWATDFGLTADVGPNQAGEVTFPFMTEAENIFFDLDGGPRKIGGTTKLNSTVINSGNEIRGLFDYWRQGTTNSPVQRRVVYSGTAIYADAANGTFSSIKTGLEDDKAPCFTVFNDALIMSSDSTVDVPLIYDSTTVSNLGGTPPRFSFSCVHKNKVWAAGVATLPSRLYYSKTLDANSADSWSTAGAPDATTGHIDIDPDDGDRITAIASYKNDLWVFKGPYKGSIHRITGSSNTGSDSFARIPFVKGVGAVAHNTLFTFRDDLGFMWSDGTIHSLKATAAYGDFNEANLSRPIQKYIRENFNLTYLSRAWAATDSGRSLVVFTVPVSTSTYCNQVLTMDYSREIVWWASWPAYNANCIARVTDASQNSLPLLMIGGRDGYVRKTNATNRSLDASTAYAAKCTLPYTDYGNGLQMKTLAGASVKLTSSGGYAIYLRWTRDDNTQQSEAFTVTDGSDLLGSTFVLGTSTLAGGAFTERFSALDEDGAGEFRSISWQLYNAGLDEDMVVRSFGASIEMGSDSRENI